MALCKDYSTKIWTPKTLRISCGSSFNFSQNGLWNTPSQHPHQRRCHYTHHWGAGKTQPPTTWTTPMLCESKNNTKEKEKGWVNILPQHILPEWTTKSEDKRKLLVKHWEGEPHHIQTHNCIQPTSQYKRHAMDIATMNNSTTTSIDILTSKNIHLKYIISISVYTINIT